MGWAPWSDLHSNYQSAHFGSTFTLGTELICSELPSVHVTVLFYFNSVLLGEIT